MSVLRMTPEQYRDYTKRHTAKPAPVSTEPRVDKGPIVLREQIIAAGLPTPYREFVFHPTRDWRLDLAWPDLNLACEVDGMVHRIKGRFRKDIEKHNALVLSGWRHVRVTPRMIETGEALDIVRRALS